MKIAILTSGILPVPAVQGGAVENLTDILLAYNDQHHLHDITVFSVYHPDIEGHQALQSKVNHYIFIHTSSLWYRLRAKLYGCLHRNECYYYALEFFFEQAYKRLSRQHYDLIILENRPGFAIKLAQRLSTPIVSHIHTNQVHEPIPQTFDIIKSTHRFLAVSQYIRDEILSLGRPADVRIVYNGLDPDFSQAPHPVRRSALGFGEDDFLAVFCGRLVPGKGIKELLQALLMLQNHPDIKLLVIGSSDFANGTNQNDYIRELHEMVSALGQRVVFTGYVPYADIPNYLSMANVSVVPSRIKEAFGMTCIEACAMGLPVIATNDGGIPETLVGQKHILIDRGKPLPDQIADALLRIKEHPDTYAGNDLPPLFYKETFAKTFYQAIEN